MSDIKKMDEDRVISRIIEIELYLTQKTLDNRMTNKRPALGDEDQPLRDELQQLRLALFSK